MKDVSVVNDQNILYILFNEFVFLGNTPKFISYFDSPKLYNDVKKFMNVSFNTDNVIFEIIYSHLYRDKDNIMKPYRLTDMKNDPILIPMNQTQHASLSITGRIVGPNLDLGIDSALVNKSENNSKIEDTLRA